MNLTDQDLRTQFAIVMAEMAKAQEVVCVERDELGRTVLIQTANGERIPAEVAYARIKENRYAFYTQRTESAGRAYIEAVAASGRQRAHLRTRKDDETKDNLDRLPTCDEMILRALSRSR